MCVRWSCAIIAACSGLFQWAEAAEEKEAGYPLSYPAAEQFCPPTAEFFDHGRSIPAAHPSAHSGQ